MNSGAMAASSTNGGAVQLPWSCVPKLEGRGRCVFSDPVPTRKVRLAAPHHWGPRQRAEQSSNWMGAFSRLVPTASRARTVALRADGRDRKKPVYYLPWTVRDFAFCPPRSRRCSLLPPAEVPSRTATHPLASFIFQGPVRCLQRATFFEEIVRVGGRPAIWKLDLRGATPTGSVLRKFHGARIRWSAPQGISLDKFIGEVRRIPFVDSVRLRLRRRRPGRRPCSPVASTPRPFPRSHSGWRGASPAGPGAARGRAVSDDPALRRVLPHCLDGAFICVREAHNSDAADGHPKHS